MNLKKAEKSLLCWIFLSPILIPILLPFVVTILTALKPRNELTKIPPQFFPSEFMWNNFLYIFTETKVLTSIYNSFIVSISATLIAILVSAPCAYAMNRFDFTGKRAYQFFLLVTQMLSPIVLVLGLFRLIVTLGLVDSLGMLSLIYAGFNIAFCVWMLQSYFSTIPKDLEESAWLEGASNMKSLLTIFLPLAIPAITIVAMFTFVNSWNEFIIALSTLRSSEIFTVQLKITEMTGYYTIRWDHIMATVIVSTLPVAIIFAWLQKYLIRGLSSGAVK